MKIRLTSIVVLLLAAMAQLRIRRSCDYGNNARRKARS